MAERYNWNIPHHDPIFEGLDDDQLDSFYEEFKQPNGEGEFKDTPMESLFHQRKKQEDKQNFGQHSAEIAKPEFKETFGALSGEAPKPEMPKHSADVPKTEQTFGQPSTEMPKTEQTFGQPPVEAPKQEAPKVAPHFTRIMDFFAPAPSPAAPAIPKTRPQSLGEHKGGVFNAAYQANKDSAYIPNVIPNLNNDYKRDQDLLQKEIDRYKDAVTQNVNNKYNTKYDKSPIELFNNPERYNRLVNLVHGNPKPAEILEPELPKFEGPSYPYDPNKDLATALATEHGPLYTRGERVLDQSLIERNPSFRETLKHLGNRNKELKGKIAPEKFKQEKSAAQSLYDEKIKKLEKPVAKNLRELMNKYFETADKEYSRRVEELLNLEKREFKYPDDFPVEIRGQYLKDDPEQSPAPRRGPEETPEEREKRKSNAEKSLDKFKQIFSALSGEQAGGVGGILGGGNSRIPKHPELPDEQWHFEKPDHEPRRKVRDEDKIKAYQEEQVKKLLSDYTKANIPYDLENDYKGIEHYLSPEDLKDYYYAYNAFHDLPYSEPPKEKLLDYFVQQRQKQMKNAFNEPPRKRIMV